MPMPNLQSVRAELFWRDTALRTHLFVARTSRHRRLGESGPAKMPSRSSQMPNPSLHPKSYIRLRRLPPSGELKR